MDQLIIYKEGESLKESFQKIRISQKRAYRLDFATSLTMLQQNLKPDTQALLYFFTNTLTNQHRVIIRNILQSCPDVCICLCSHESMALDAWKLQLFHFEAFPIDGHQIKTAYRRYVNQLSESQSQINIKTAEGLLSIPYRTINYLKADGNYTEIHLQQGKKRVITKQLNAFMYTTEENLQMNRLHRSYIFNLTNIRQVKGKELYFYRTETPLQLSQALSDKLKKTLLAI